ncbi:putative Seipin family protein [Helianthus debilis subsp. tardiflorus]
MWYSKWLIYMSISITMYIMELLFTLLCCRSIIFPWEQSLGRDLSSSNTTSRTLQANCTWKFRYD